nr:BamA/TamA family outer membrane protein [Gloeothece citriformis]
MTGSTLSWPKLAQGETVESVTPAEKEGSSLSTETPSPSNPSDVNTQETSLSTAKLAQEQTLESVTVAEEVSSPSNPSDVNTQETSLSTAKLAQEQTLESVTAAEEGSSPSNPSDTNTQESSLSTAKLAQEQTLESVTVAEEVSSPSNPSDTNTQESSQDNTESNVPVATETSNSASSVSVPQKKELSQSPPIPQIENQPSQTPPVVPPPAQPNTPQPDTTETPPTQDPRVLVAEVVITGADTELENLVYNVIRTRPGRATTRTQLQEDVNAIYGTGFFENVRVIPEDTPLGVRVTFAVDPNPILRDVAIETVPATVEQRVLPPEVVNEIFQEQYNKILNLRQLQEGIQKINEWYSSQGYDLAQVIGSPQVSDEGVVTLVIAEGVIEDIQVQYFDEDDEPRKARTKPYIITREMRLEPGEVFNRNTAQQDLQRIFGLGLFEDVRFSFEPGENPQEVVVNVEVVEGNTGSLAAGAGISSSSGLFGTVSYQQQNLFGRNQSIGGEVQVGERELLFDVNFSDPWIAGDPFRTSYTANLFRRQSISLVYDGSDSTIRTDDGDDSPRVVRTGGGVTFVRPLAKDVFSKPDWTLAASVLYQNVRIENADGDLSPRSAPRFGSQLLAFNESGVDDIFSLSFSASRDFRNNPLQPTSGYVARIGVEQSIPTGSEGITFNRWRGSYSYYIPVKFLRFDFMNNGPQALAFNVQAGTIFGDLPPYEAFVLGGSNSVRGYAEGEVGSGRSYFQATAEYRFPIFSVVGGALFLDYGTTLGSQGAVPGKPGEVRDLPGSGFGYGFGVRIQSPVGPIRVDYGFNDEGDSRLNFGIGERF